MNSGMLPERLRRIVPALVFLFLPALMILPQLGSGRFLFGHDVTMGFYHAYGVIGRALASGRLPVWNPHAMAGAPLLAAIHNAVLYPPTWLAALLQPGAYWTLSVAAHLSLTGFFAYAWLARGLSIGRWGALAGASMVMLSGFMISHVFGGHLSIVCTVPWAAAALWRLERFLASPSLKRAALLSVVLLLMLLAGHPQTAMIAGVAVAARLVHFVVERREGMKDRARLAGLAAGALAAGVLLALPQLLPTIELTRHTQRASMNDFEFSSSYSFPPESLATLAAPTFFGDSTTVPYWGRWLQWDVVGFLGISSLALAALGAAGRHPQRFLWLGLAVGGLLLSMGHHTPLFKAFFHLVPGAGYFRVPGRYLLLFTLAVAPLVAMGFDRLWVGDDRARRAATIIAAAAALLLLVSGGFWISLRSPEGGESERWKSILDAEASAARGQRDETYLAGPKFRNDSHALANNSLAIASLCLAGVAGALLAARWTRPAWSAAALGLILGTELISFDARFITDHRDEELRWPESFAENVRSHPQFPFRIATLGDADIDAVGRCQLAGLDHLGGYDPMMLRRYLELCRAANGVSDAGYAASMSPLRPSPIYDLLGGRYWIIRGPKQVPPGWGDVGAMGDRFVYENPRALPRAFLVARSVVLPSAAEQLRTLAGPAFDPGRTVCLETGAGETLAEGGAGTVAIRSHSAGFYDLRADCASEGWLVLTEAHYPGWEVEVDGAPAELLRADHLVQAVRLTRGTHSVRFQYRPRSLHLGAAVSGLTILAAAGLSVALRRRKASVPQSAAQ